MATRLDNALPHADLTPEDYTSATPVTPPTWMDVYALVEANFLKAMEGVALVVDGSADLGTLPGPIPARLAVVLTSEDGQPRLYVLAPIGHVDPADAPDGAVESAHAGRWWRPVIAVPGTYEPDPDDPEGPPIYTPPPPPVVTPPAPRTRWEMVIDHVTELPYGFVSTEAGVDYYRAKVGQHRATGQSPVFEIPYVIEPDLSGLAKNRQTNTGDRWRLTTRLELDWDRYSHEPYAGQGVSVDITVDGVPKRNLYSDGSGSSGTVQGEHHIDIEESGSAVGLRVGYAGLQAGGRTRLVLTYNS